VPLNSNQPTATHCDRPQQHKLILPRTPASCCCWSYWHLGRPRYSWIQQIPDSTTFGIRAGINAALSTSHIHLSVYSRLSYMSLSWCCVVNGKRCLPNSASLVVPPDTNPSHNVEWNDVLCSKWNSRGIGTCDLTSGQCVSMCHSQYQRLQWYCTTVTACRATSGGSTTLWVV